jgi:hypothetical protein
MLGYVSRGNDMPFLALFDNYSIISWVQSVIAVLIVYQNHRFNMYHCD